MIELVHTSVPHGLLSGDGGFCTVAATKDVPAALRQRLEQLSSYKHLVSAPGPQYERGNPVAWSHLVLQTGEHLLSCVRACDFDYTNRTNRIARHWCFSPREVPEGTNFADVLLHGAAEELSTPWTGEPRWLPPRSGSPLAASTDRSDCRPVAWNALFGESRGPALAAGFAAALIHAVRDGGRGVVFKTSPAADADGVRALGLFADLLALVPADLRSRVIFSTYPATLPAWMPRHLVCLQSGDPALAAFATFVDLERGTVEGAERLPQDADLLHLAQYGRKQAPPPTIRPFASSSASSAPVRHATSPGRTPVAPTGRIVRAPSGRLVSRTQVKKTKPEDILIYVLCGAIVLGAVVLAAMMLRRTPPPTVTESTTPTVTTTTTTTSTTRPPAETSVPKHKTNAVPGKVSPPKERESTNNVAKTKPDKPQQVTDPLLSAEKIEFSMPTANRWFGDKGAWYFYDKNGILKTSEISIGNVMGAKSFKNEPKEARRRLAFNPIEKKIYWSFSPENGTGWFADGKPVNLREVFFGPDPRVFDAWMNVLEKQTGNKWTECYMVTFSGEPPEDKARKSSSTGNDPLPPIMGQYLDKQLVITAGMAGQVADYDRRIKVLTESKKQHADALKEAQNQLAELEKRDEALKKSYENIQDLKKKKDDEKDEKKKKAFEDQIKKAEEKRKELPGANDNPDSRKFQIDAARKTVDNEQAAFDRASEALSKAEKDKQEFEKQKDITEWLRKLYFTVEPVRPEIPFGK